MNPIKDRQSKDKKDDTSPPSIFDIVIEASTEQEPDDGKSDVKKHDPTPSQAIEFVIDVEEPVEKKDCVIAGPPDPNKVPSTKDYGGVDDVKGIRRCIIDTSNPFYRTSPCYRRSSNGLCHTQRYRKQARS